MILVTGAGGKTGKALIKSLSKSESVCAFVHREEHVPALRSLGAEKVVVGDLRDGGTIRSAMQGARSVYHICPNMSPDETVIGNSVLGAAREAGVEHFVYHSVLHPQTERMNHHRQKLRVEEMIFESGLPFTILQPAPYMQNLLANWKSIVEGGILRVPYSVNARFSFLDLDDLAEAAKIVMTEPGHLQATYELAGTAPISHAEVAEIFGHILKRQVRAEREGIGDWKQRASSSLATNARSAQREEYAIENLIRMFEYYDQWGLAGNPNILKSISKREPRSLESFILSAITDKN